MSAKPTAADTLPPYENCSNYPTFAAAVWVDNVESDYLALCRLAKRHANSNPARWENAVRSFIRDYIYGSKDDENGAYNDIREFARSIGRRADWAINRINFAELAEQFKEYAQH